jgi:diguanylate cyclase (GGDEF)-like protein
MLRRAGAHVRRGPGKFTADEPPEVLLTNLDQVDVAGLEGPGIVKVGADGPADVRLPADCTARELRLACGLLAQVVRLRRRERVAAELHRRLSAAALTDPLTGLPNRRAWDAAVLERLTLAAGVPRQLCLAILDLDHFKRINDKHGHIAGDEVLRQAGRAVYDSLRQDDFVARLGGDEFGLLLWVPDEPMAARIIDRVRIALACRLAQTAAPGTTASAGYRLAECHAGGGSAPVAPASPEALFAAADAALREAKRRGRDRAVGSRRDGVLTT